jgi:ubiquinone/menaquinone biosynthesis C-methylase UbiE
MIDAALLSCPLCHKDMKSFGVEMRCECGYCLEFSEGYFKIRNDNYREKSYAELYTESYYTSSLYDDTDYRVNRIISLAGPQTGRRILDVGCGRGGISFRCAKLGADTVGIDISRDALKLCAESCGREDVEVSLFEFDGRNIPFKDATFDAIILSDVAEHVEDDLLHDLIKECSRLLTPGGRLVIHTAPTRYIIMLSKIIKAISLGKLDYYSRLIDPDYEYLHIRYHSTRSIREILERNGLYPALWGDFRFIHGCNLEKLANNILLRGVLADQLWAVAFKEKELSKPSFNHKPYLNFIGVPSELCLGRCNDLFINYGFYNREADYFRWTGKAASIYLLVPEGYKRLEVDMSTSPILVREEPVSAILRLGGIFVSKFSIPDDQMHKYSFEIPKRLGPGITELDIEVSKTFVPKEQGINDDTRELGVVISKIKMA